MNNINVHNSQFNSSANANIQRNMRSLAVQNEKTSERISNGKKINSAADDPVGLVNIEKLTALINGLSKGEANSYDGMNMLNVAEGGMSEIQDILGRQRDLALQSMNGILSDENRALIQTEFSQLTGGIDAIAHNTEFNGIKVLLGGGAVANTVPETGSPDGGNSYEGMPLEGMPIIDSRDYDPGYYFVSDLPSKTFELGANDRTYIGYVDYSVEGMPMPNSTGSTIHYSYTTFAFSTEGLDLENVNIMLSDSRGYEYSASLDDILNNRAGLGFLGEAENNNNLRLSIQRVGDSDQLRVGLSVAVGYGNDTRHTGTADGRVTFSLVNNSDDNYNVTFDATGTVNTELTKQLPFKKEFIGGYFDNGELAESGGYQKEPNNQGAQRRGGVWIQMGANAMQGMYVTLHDARASELGIDNLSVDSQENAQNALSSIDSAINTISDYRTTTGAEQNRLQAGITSLGIGHYEASSARSRIEDSDMAMEVMKKLWQQTKTQANIILMTQQMSSKGIMKFM